MLDFISEYGLDLIILLILQYDAVSLLLLKKYKNKLKKSNLPQGWMSPTISVVFVLTAVMFDNLILDNFFFRINILVMAIICLLLILMNYLIIFKLKSKIVENKNAKMIRDVIYFDFNLFNYIAGIKSKKVVLVIFFIIMIIFWAKQCFHKVVFS